MQISEKARAFFPTFVKLLCIFSVLAILACHSYDSSRSDSRSDISVPTDLHLVIGEGGGFTGEWNGYTVDSSGSVFSWRGTKAEEHSQRASKLTATQFRELWNSIADGYFFEIDSSGTGNMTQFMTVSANGKVHRVSWAKSSATASDLTPVQRIYNTCRGIITRDR
jgi:hypothetical protein